MIICLVLCFKYATSYHAEKNDKESSSSELDTVSLWSHNILSSFDLDF